MLASAQGDVLVLCGPGNNGGDGFVVADELAEAGCAVTVVSLVDHALLPDDARAACETWLLNGGSIETEIPERTFALVIDALFGIGLTRAIEGRCAEWIAWVNAMSCLVLSLDIPSGLHSESGVVMGTAIKATHTATFIALKPGLLTLDGPDYCGEISVHDLGLPLPENARRCVSTALFSHRFKPRKHNVHKGSFGTLGIIGGAKGMLGAALLASRASVLLGTGKVLTSCLDESGFSVDISQPEFMFRALEDIFTLADVLVIGPGMSQGEAAGMVLPQALAFEGPLLLDADALNLIAKSDALQALLAGRKLPVVLTPHPAEAARLLHSTVAVVQRDRIGAAQQLARILNAVTVLKGCGSVIATPDGRWFINTSGHAGMASSGMGDVLSGLIGALLAQGWSGLEAAMAGVHLHGKAAEALAEQGVGPIGVSASETIPAARALFNAWMASGA